ncbi:alpha-protein kinase vwkA-like [Gigantopelta aegis]|uniref:alpha-protein kinase vwkA-like n=1 Tax=Gigantopelta aegis TaxID=1735272 RepID=UPI001B88D9D5|nr:alpha-protein kinase vwkA-like [Gigantopelta aegis]
MAAMNITHLFTGDCQGNQYTASFDARPFVSGARKMVYKGVLTGQGPRNNETVIIKPFREFAGSKELCELEMAKNHEAHRICQNYNKVSSCQSLHFILPLKAELHRPVAIAASNNAGHVRQLQPAEWVLIEENIGDDFRKFVDDRGRSTTAGSSLLHAFIHYSYHVSKGALVVSCLQGVPQADGKYTLDTPTIHSIQQRFGDSDKGEPGILQVFINHKCNNLCRDYTLPKMLKNLDPSGV